MTRILDSEVSAGASDGGPEHPSVCCPRPPGAQSRYCARAPAARGTAPQLLRVLLAGCLLKMSILLRVSPFSPPEKTFKESNPELAQGIWSEVHGKHPLL